MLAKAARNTIQNFVTLYSDGTLHGQVVDDSEQLVINAIPSFLNVPNNPAQYDDPGLNPIILVPLPEHITTCEELMAYRDELFHPEPEF